MCVFFSHLFWTSSSLDVPAGVTQEERHTGFLIRLPSAVRALIFLARRIQPFLSLVDREVEFCVSTCWAFLFIYFLVRKIPFTGIRTHVSTCQKVTRLLLSYRGDRLLCDTYSRYQCSPFDDPFMFSSVVDHRCLVSVCIATVRVNGVRLPILLVVS